MPDNTTTHFTPPVNHVFVDFENVHKVDLEIIGTKTIHFTLLLGARQTRLDAALVEKLLDHAGSVQLVRLAASGKNALDFTLAYYVGRAATADPAGCFHIISKDKGFDPLIAHLQSRNIRAQRHDDFTKITFPGPGGQRTPAPEDPLNRVVEHLRRNTSNRPKRKKTLISHLRAYLGKASTEKDVELLVDRLEKSGHLAIGDKDVVTFKL